MELVDARDDGDNGVQDMEMILIDKRGNRRERTIRAMARTSARTTTTVDDVLPVAGRREGHGLPHLRLRRRRRDDDQWLYLPALKKTKRIASGDKSGSFMGSDFSYADMTDRKLDRYDYTT